MQDVDTEVTLYLIVVTSVPSPDGHRGNDHLQNRKTDHQNNTIIQGAGTTGERNEYTWTDTTAKPNTVYYYQIEDVSHAGVREQLATVRLRGLVSAIGKLTTIWADLKAQE